MMAGGTTTHPSDAEPDHALGPPPGLSGHGHPAARPPGHREVAAIAGLAAAGGVHLAVGLDHRLGAGGHGLALLAAAVAQLTVAAMLCRRVTTWRRGLAALVAIGVTLAWAASRLNGDHPAGLLDGAAAAVQLVAAGTLLSSGRARRVVRPVPVALVAIAGLLAGLASAAVVPAGHHHLPSTPPPEAATPPTPSIFGDLFVGHGHHSPGTTAPRPARTTSAVTGTPTITTIDHEA